MYLWTLILNRDKPVFQKMRIIKFYLSLYQFLSILSIIYIVFDLSYLLSIFLFIYLIYYLYYYLSTDRSIFYLSSLSSILLSFYPSIFYLSYLLSTLLSVYSFLSLFMHTEHKICNLTCNWNTLMDNQLRGTDRNFWVTRYILVIRALNHNTPTLGCLCCGGRFGVCVQLYCVASTTLRPRSICAQSWA